MQFIDETTVQVTAGNGGDGVVRWRREKFIPMGGPYGGSGGCGAAVVFLVEEGINTLIDLFHQPIIKAEDGGAGDANNRTGKDGEDLIIKVPPGTQVFFNDKLVADLSKPGSRWIAARGGNGGKGNLHFTSSTNQAPDYAQKGQAAESFSFRLVLKSVADVGLVGPPNVGKSTFISVISAAHPKIADYPFTTLEPHLGTVVIPDGPRFVVADIPGIIPDAHQGKGLGLKFLKHIERTKVIAQFLDIHVDQDGNGRGIDEEACTDEELLTYIKEHFEFVSAELASYSETLLTKPRMVLFSKGDLPLTKRAFELGKEFFEAENMKVFLISSVTRDGIDECLNELGKLVMRSRKPSPHTAD
jgi:GTPase